MKFVMRASNTFSCLIILVDLTGVLLNLYLFLYLPEFLFGHGLIAIWETIDYTAIRHGHYDCPDAYATIYLSRARKWSILRILVMQKTAELAAISDV